MWRATPQPSRKINQCPEGSIIVDSSVLWRINTIDQKISIQLGGRSAIAQGIPPQHRMLHHIPEGLATARHRSGGGVAGLLASWQVARCQPSRVLAAAGKYLGPTLLDTPINRRVKPIAFSSNTRLWRSSVRGHKSETRLPARPLYNYALWVGMGVCGRGWAVEGVISPSPMFPGADPPPTAAPAPPRPPPPTPSCPFWPLEHTNAQRPWGDARPPIKSSLPAGRGGSPPGSQEALLEATRLTMWKLYNQGLGVGGGFQHEDDGPKLPPPHHPLAGVPFPPQKEALNLEVKDEEVPLFHDNRGYQPFCLQRTGRLKDAVDHRNDLRNDVRNDLRNDLRNELRNDIRNEFRNDVRSRLEEAAIPPSAKRPAQQDDSHDSRLPPPTTPTPPTPPGYPGANIKITSRGGRGQDQSMVVSMEVNGIMYQGVLFAQAPRARFS
ncbi:hypothetical protein O3P69_013336 [Scylla paramamosain]|uniref:REKLES domain-containing protein n=1 Tax=Scylla paramamosain TaxID=85552 RepID=A0AAW0U1D0_SCYPA